MPTSVPNATMILNVAQIDMGKMWPLLSRHALSCAAECCRARLEVGQVRHRVKLQEPGKRRADRQHLVPVNNSQRSASFREIMREQRLKRVASIVKICGGASSVNVKWGCSCARATASNTASRHPIPQSIDENWYR